MLEDFYYGTPVLVTGGAGFIGGHLVEKLVSLGAHVTVLDNLETGFMHNLANVQDKITFIQKSVEDFDACLQATNNKKVVFHLAAFISVPASVEHPRLCHTTNVDGTFNILEACRINNVERFVFSSSSAVYGATEEICSEDRMPSPTSPYGASKLIGELLCQQFAQICPLKTVCLRYFNVYGDRQNPHAAYAAVVAKFKYQMRNNLPITIFGDGQQRRDFVPVSTVVQANLTMGMLAPELNPGEVFNVATGKSINLFELVDLLKDEFPEYQPDLKFAPARPGDVKFSQANANKFHQIIDQI